MTEIRGLDYISFPSCPTNVHVLSPSYRRQQAALHNSRALLFTLSSLKARNCTFIWACETFPTFSAKLRTHAAELWELRSSLTSSVASVQGEDAVAAG